VSKFIVEKLTKINLETQNQILRLFVKVDISTKLKILEQQKSSFHILKSTYVDVDNAILTLVSLILATDSVTKSIDRVNLNAIKLRGKNNKAKIKRQRVLGYWAIVRTLKIEQKMSFRNISTYFAKYHKLEVSYSTIYDLWIELEKKKKN